MDIADELIYAGENAFTNNVRPTPNGNSNANSSPFPSSSPANNSIRQRCFTCGGSGIVDCSVCGGAGGKYEYISTPNYGGRNTSKRAWVRCSNFNCRNGKVECRRCNGTGYID